MTTQARKAAFFLVIAMTLVPRTSSLAQDVAGRWAGRMEPTNLSAEIELELRRASGGWNAEMTYRAGPDGGSAQCHFA